MSGGRTRRNVGASTLLILKASLKAFAVNRDLETAATLAFYGFLSLMPLLLLAVVVLGAVLGSSENVFTALQRVLADIFPTFNFNLLGDMAGISFKGVVGVISVLLLLWSMTPLSGALRSALAKMFKIPMAMSFFKSKLIDFATILCFIFLFLLLTVMKVVLPGLMDGDGTAAALFQFTVRSVLPFVLSVLFLGLFFRVFSPVRLSWHHWLLGAVAVTLLWGVMRNLFVAFVQFNPNFGYAFGSLKAIFLLIVWVYYSFAALLLGAEIMANTYRRDALLLHGLLQQHFGNGGGRTSRLMKKFERTMKKGEVLFREGDAGHEMYVVLEGSVRLLRGDFELAVMRRGQYFGEMSLLRDTPRSATARAAEATRLAVINKGNFDLLVRENPSLVRGLLEELAHRLEETNLKLHG